MKGMQLMMIKIKYLAIKIDKTNLNKKLKRNFKKIGTKLEKYSIRN